MPAPAKRENSLFSELNAWVRHLQRFVDRWWYFPVVGFLAGADLFIFIVPTDALLVSSVAVRPGKWLWAAFCVALGSALGGLLLAWAIHWDVNWVMQLAPSAFQSDAWKWMDGFFDRYGQVALLLISMSPMVQFPAIGIAALTGMPLWDLFVLCLIGRSIKCGVIAFIASNAPKLLKKLPFIQRELKTLEPPDLNHP